MLSPQAALDRLIDGNELFYDEMLDLMRQIMLGELTPAQTAAILIGLRVKVESVSEITAAATVLREMSIPLAVCNRDHLIDTCGTGGDKFHTFNISTTAAFVAAAAGARVAKHAGRSASSTSGSADVLEALGVNLHLTPEQAAICLDELGIGLLFAPHHHPAMKQVVQVRKELGARTIFNILGPLLNPARAESQLMGVFHPDLVGIQCRVLQQLGSKRVMIVHGKDGMDELTLSDVSMVAELKDGRIHEYEVNPRELGFSFFDVKAIQIDSIDQAKAVLLSVLDNQPGPARDIVLLNAAAAIYVADVAPSLHEAVDLAKVVLDSGLAYQTFTQFVELTNKLALLT